MGQDSEEKPKKLDYVQVNILEDQGKKYTGQRLDSWQDGKGVCSSCRNAMIIRQSSKNQRTIHCSEINAEVPDDISECNSYKNFTQLTLGQMAEIATLIDPRPDGYKGYL